MSFSLVDRQQESPYIPNTRMKKTFIILASMLLAYGSMVTGCNRANADSSTKIISYNIRLSTVNDGPNNWELRKEATIRMINQEEPAAFGLQEAMPEQIHYLEEQLPDYHRVGVGREDGHESGEHCAIFYRHKDYHLLEQRTLWLSQTPDSVSMGWDAACLRTATFAKLQNRKDARTFWYINTHLDHIGQIARRSSIELLIKWIEAIRAEEPDTPILLGGDMNATLEDPIFSPLLTLMKVAPQTAPQTDEAGTYNGWGKVHPAAPIDHFFYLGMQPVRFDNLNGDYGVPFISDHYPISFTWM